MKRESEPVLAFAHAGCLPSQVVKVTEEQLQGAVRSISADQARSESAPAAPPAFEVRVCRFLLTFF